MNPLPTANTVDPWPEILHLLPQKITYGGRPASGPPEQLRGFAKWMMGQMPAVVSDGDEEHKANCFLQWLRSEQSYEADEKTRMTQQAAVQQAPANPISDQTTPQVAQVAAPAPAPAAAPAAAGEEAAGPGLVCPECGAQAKNLTGLKRHCTMTHKTDWSAIAQKHGLDINTGLKLGTQPAPAAAPVASAPPPPPAAAPVPPMFGAPGQATQAPSYAPPPPPLPGQMSIPFAQSTVPQPAPPAQPPAVQPMQQPQFQQPTMPQQPPQFQPPAFASQQPTTMPQPPTQVAAGAIPMTGVAPAPFVPPSFPAPQAPQAPAVPPAHNFFDPPASAQAPAPAAPPGPLVAYSPTPAPAPAPVAIGTGAPTREALATMLGGPVDLFVVRLLDAATVKLDGRVDVNQLAMISEQRARNELQVTELAAGAGQYSVGKQRAQRHFADLLTQNPNCYMLQNGYDPIIPDGYIAILSSRVVRFHIATDNGRQVTTIF